MKCWKFSEPRGPWKTAAGGVSCDNHGGKWLSLSRECEPTCISLTSPPSCAHQREILQPGRRHGQGFVSSSGTKASVPGTSRCPLLQKCLYELLHLLSIQWNSKPHKHGQRVQTSQFPLVSNSNTSQVTETPYMGQAESCLISRTHMR